MRLLSIIAIIGAGMGLSSTANAQDHYNTIQSLTANINSSTQGTAFNVCCSVGFDSLAGANSVQIQSVSNGPKYWNNNQQFRGDAIATTFGNVANVNGDVALGAKAFGNSAAASFDSNCCININSYQFTGPMPARPVGDPTAIVNGNVSNVGGNVSAIATAASNAFSVSAPNAKGIQGSATQINGTLTLGSASLNANNIGGNAIAASSAFGNSMSFMGGANTGFNVNTNQITNANVTAFTGINASNIGGHVVGTSSAIGNSFSVGTFK